MTNPVETQAAQVIVNKMTQAQYDQITPSDTEFYLITDAETPVESLENQNSNENPVKAWTGTKTEYDEIGTYFAYTYGVTTVYVRKVTPTTSDTVYSAVGTASALTISSVSTGSMTLSDSNTYVRDTEEDTVDSTQYNSSTLYNIKDDTDTTLSLLNLIYPVGSIYIGTMNACPLQSIGLGTWQLVAADRVLQGAGTRGSVGSTVNESLPNIVGEYDTDDRSTGPANGGGTGALRYTNNGESRQYTTRQGTNGGSNLVQFDASLSSSTYQNNAPVQQDAYLVNIWERVS